jgi:hypothetical protein
MLSELNVTGSDSFFMESPLKSLFFLADTLFLLIASAIDIFVLTTQQDILVRTRLGVVLFGMWFLWRKAWVVHRQVRALEGTMGSETTTSPLQQMKRITASMTHLGMLFTYILNILLLTLIAKIVR